MAADYRITCNPSNGSAVMNSPPPTQIAPDRAAFEKWLMDIHGLDSTWNEERNCFNDFPAHLAFKAWQQAREKTIRECAAIANKYSMEAKPGSMTRLTASSILAGYLFPSSTKK